MAITFDPVQRLIQLDTASVTAVELYSRWVDWVTQSDNIKWPPAFTSVGGVALGGGAGIPAYYFLMNNWRIRPMPANHDLTLTGNLAVDGGVGEPFVNADGPYQVNIKYVIPVAAQTLSIGGNLSPVTLAEAVRDALSIELQAILSIKDRTDMLPVDPASESTLTAVSSAATETRTHVRRIVAFADADHP